ncbi:DUF6544 family protein [Hymenobacter koreensis]|uniref:DUF4292 domain-containing protein n=1 Tax=Hymenobacter koreensis TaxID=1084523 RepID=A0ABP8J6C3_9BACT
MLRLIGTALLALHGLIHLVGLRPLANRSLAGNGPLLMPLGWAAAALLLGVAAAGLALKKPWWWAVAALGLLLSQTLIVLNWREAWAGTILNVGLMLAVVLAAAFATATRRVRTEAQALAAAAATPPAQLVLPGQLAGLPAPAQRYFTYAGVLNRPLTQAVVLRQTGRIRTRTDQPWMEMKAEQYFTVRPASFLWLASMREDGVPFLQVCDRYVAGRGNTLVRPGALLTVADVRGPEMDQGALQRYLAEAVWFPSAYLQDNVRLEAVSDDAFSATLTDAGQQVTVTLHVDAEGKLTKVTARRYREENGRFSLANWMVQTLDYGEFAGLRVPTRLRVVWQLPAGDFEPIQLTLTELQLQPAALPVAS